MEGKDIRRWYHDHGIPYLEEDWGERADTGESGGPQTQQPQRAAGASVRTIGSTPDMMWWWEKQPWPWRERGDSERDWLLLLDDFFLPYLALLPRAKGNLLRQVFGDLATYQEVGDAERVSRQAAQQSTVRALRALTRVIAEDDPAFVAPPDGRRRDYEAEAEAAKRVFLRFVEGRQ